jgi:hypothetical protein
VGHAPVEGVFLIALGDRNRSILITFPERADAVPPRRALDEPRSSSVYAPARRSSTPLVLGYGLLALGAAAAGSFAIFEVLGQNDYTAMRDSCARTHSCPQSNIDATHAKFVAAGVSLAVAAAAGGAGGILVFTSRPSSVTTANIELGPGAVRARFRF